MGLAPGGVAVAAAEAVVKVSNELANCFSRSWVKASFIVSGGQEGRDGRLADVAQSVTSRFGQGGVVDRGNQLGGGVVAGFAEHVDAGETPGELMLLDLGGSSQRGDGVLSDFNEGLCGDVPGFFDGQQIDELLDGRGAV